MGNDARRHRVVIVGGGFAGLRAASGLRKADCDVTLIDQRNFHLFQPLLYQVATGGLSPANIAAPLRSILHREKNIKVVLGEVVGIDVAGKSIQLRDKSHIAFDTLVIATGATHNYFGHDNWAELAPGLKSVEDATEIRRRILGAFERAEQATDPIERDHLLTFVVVGGGPTGVELAGAISELSRLTMRYDFRNIDPRSARIVIVEGQKRLLSSFHPKLSARAERTLLRMGVTLHLGCHVKEIARDHVVYQSDTGDPNPTTIGTHTVIWAAGVQASSLANLLAEAIGGIPVDRAGRIDVNSDCTVGKRQDIFVLGDMARQMGSDGKQLPGVASVAMQQGEYVAKLISRRLKGDSSPTVPFRYWDKGSMATIGRARAVAETGGIRLSGFVAWLAWLFIHILYLASFQNRVLVLWQWFFNYMTRNSAARLITGGNAQHLDDTTIPQPITKDDRK